MGDGQRVRRFVIRHPALTICAAFMALIIVLDRVFDLHALAMTLALYLAISMADAWDEETR